MSNVYAIAYLVDCTNLEEPFTYVKMKPHMNSRGFTEWTIKPVHSYTEATKWNQSWQAEKTIKNTPSFNGEGSVTAIVVTSEVNAVN
jgi:hypothetical protein